MQAAAKLCVRARLATFMPLALSLFSQCGGSQSPPPHHAVADEPTASFPTYVPRSAPPPTASGATLSPTPASSAPAISPNYAAPAAAEDDAAPTGTLLAHYTFDDCSARDVTGNGHDGRLVGKPNCVAGPNGKALHFDGKQYVTIEPIGSDTALRSQLSVTGWVNASGFNEHTPAL